MEYVNPCATTAESGVVFNQGRLIGWWFINMQA